MHLSWINATDSTEWLYLPVSCWIIYENRCWKDRQFQNKCIIWWTTSSFHCGHFTHIVDTNANSVPIHPQLPPCSQSSSIHDTSSRVMNSEGWPLTCKLSGGGVYAGDGGLFNYVQGQSWILLIRFRNTIYWYRKCDTGIWRIYSVHLLLLGLCVCAKVCAGSLWLLYFMCSFRLLHASSISITIPQHVDMVNKNTREKPTWIHKIKNTAMFLLVRISLLW